MSSKNEVTPVRIGLLIDYLDDDGRFDENILPSLQLVADEYVEQGLLERPVEFVVRAVQGLPNGSFRAVRNAFFELVEQDSLVIFGPWVSENGAALRRYVEDLAEVARITMGASETMLGEWVFGLPAGSMEEEPIVMATVAAYDGCRTVGVAFEDSLIGTEYLRTTRVACHEAGLRITAEVAIPQVESGKRTAMAKLAAGPAPHTKVRNARIGPWRAAPASPGECTLSRFLHGQALSRTSRLESTQAFPLRALVADARSLVQ